MDEKTINTYNQMALEYDKETIDFWELFPRTFVDRFIELAGKEVLDIGSGPGRDGLILQEAGKEVVCADASKAMVELSSGRGLRSVIADFTKLPFENESFDAAWSYTAFLHVPKKDVGAPLDEAYRILRPSGIFGLGMIEGDFDGYRDSSGVDMPRWFSHYEKSELEKLICGHGFEAVYFEQFKPRSRNYLNFIFRKR